MSLFPLEERWYNAEKSNVGSALLNDFQTVTSHGVERYDRIDRYRHMYRDRVQGRARPWTYRERAAEGGPIPENMLRPLVDTLTAKLIRNRPRVTAATIGGGLEARTRARNLSLFWDGVWQQTRVHAKLGRYVREGLVTGEGVFHPCKEISADGKKGKINIEVVSLSELYVDDVEAFYGNPRSMYRQRFIDRGWLMKIFPEQAAQIKVAAQADTSDASVLAAHVDLVEVIEGWYLPSRDGAGDGRYVMAVGEVVLRDAEWLYDDFPFVRFCPSPPMACDGFWGTGIVEQLHHAQAKLSAVANTVNESQHLLGHPMIFINKGSEVNTRHIKNISGVFVEYAGSTPPVVSTPDPVARQMYQDVDNRRAKMVEDSGVSRMSLTSSKPVGFDPSGRAIQEMADVETERFMEMGRALEESMVQLAAWTVRLAQELDEELKSGFKMVARDGREALELAWKDVSLDDDAYVMHVEATAWQGRSIAGRIADVERLANSGAITDPLILAKMLDMPDVDAYLDEAASPTRVVEVMAEVMLTTGRFIPPEPYMQLDAAIVQMQLIYLREVAKRKGADDERLELIRRWLDNAAGMLQQEQQAAAAAQQAAAPAPAPVDAGVAPGGAELGGLPPEVAGGVPGLEGDVAAGELPLV